MTFCQHKNHKGGDASHLLEEPYRGSTRHNSMSLDVLPSQCAMGPMVQRTSTDAEHETVETAQKLANSIVQLYAEERVWLVWKMANCVLFILAEDTQRQYDAVQRTKMKYTANYDVDQIFCHAMALLDHAVARDNMQRCFAEHFQRLSGYVRAQFKTLDAPMKMLHLLASAAVAVACKHSNGKDSNLLSLMSFCSNPAAFGQQICSLPYMEYLTTTHYANLSQLVEAEKMLCNLLEWNFNVGFGYDVSCKLFDAWKNVKCKKMGVDCNSLMSMYTTSADLDAVDNDIKQAKSLLVSCAAHGLTTTCRTRDDVKKLATAIIEVVLQHDDNGNDSNLNALALEVCKTTVKTVVLAEHTSGSAVLKSSLFAAMPLDPLKFHSGISEVESGLVDMIMKTTRTNAYKLSTSKQHSTRWAFLNVVPIISYGHYTPIWCGQRIYNFKPMKRKASSQLAEDSLYCDEEL